MANRTLSAVTAACIALNSAPADAASNLISQPVQIADENVRYQHGQATVDIYSESGSIQVRPAAMDHGSLAFAIAVFNNGSTPSNVDISNFTIEFEGKTYKPFSVEILEKKARSRAGWATFALALAGGLSAAAAASQRDYYTGTVSTPRGLYTSTYSAPSTFGQIQAATIAAGTGVGIYAIQNRLDHTLDNLQDAIVQLSTVDPGQSYGGMIIFEKIKFKKLPAQVDMTADWNGHQYHLRFQIAKPGTPAPPFKPAAVYSEPAAAAQVVPNEAAPSPAPELQQQAAPASETPETTPSA